MRYLPAFVSYLSSSSVLAAATPRCKCTPDSSCWPPDNEWTAFNDTLHGALIRGTPPGSVCYPDQPNYDEKTCEFVTSQWHNSTWHAENPVSIDYPYWTNNSCTPIYPNGTSITGDPNAGANGCSIGAYPEFVVNACSAEQVATSLKWAANKNVRVVVKATGHSFQGRSIGYGSLSIWTHDLRGIEYIPDFIPTSCPIDGTLTAVRAAAGHNGIEVQAALASHGMIAVTGANPDVGLVGWLTGGGHGTLSQTYGMGADNLLEATIVTPSGNVLVANPCVNSDLFFAIRGGGGSTYGVVTELVMRTYPSPSVVAHTLQLMSLSPNTSTEFWDFAGFFHTEMPRLKKGGLQGYYSLVGPPTTPTASFSGIFILYDTTINATKELMAPVTQYLDERSNLFAYQANFTEAPTYMDAYQYWPNEQVAGGGSALGSRLLTAESLSDASKTAETFSSISQYSDPSNETIIKSTGLLGHMVASPNTPTYYPDVISMNPAWRKALTHFIIVEGWQDGLPREVTDAYFQDVTKKTDVLRQLAPDTGAYLNEADAYEPEWQQAFFGENYDRLLSIKQKYDPGNVLWCRKCVGSDALVEEDYGKLCFAA